MLNRLKTFDAEQMDVDELVEMSLFARQLRSEYEALNLEVPEWLDDQTRALRLAIKSRTQDLIAKRLREAKAKRSTLKTTEEKRKELDQEIADLEKMQTA